MSAQPQFFRLYADGAHDDTAAIQRILSAPNRDWITRLTPGLWEIRDGKPVLLRKADDVEATK